MTSELNRANDHALQSERLMYEAEERYASAVFSLRDVRREAHIYRTALWRILVSAWGARAKTIAREALREGRELRR